MRSFTSFAKNKRSLFTICANGKEKRALEENTAITYRLALENPREDNSHINFRFGFDTKRAP